MSSICDFLFIDHINFIFMIIILFFILFVVYCTKYRKDYKMLIKLKEVENNTAISLRKLIDIIPDPVICKDDDGLYTECNKEFEKVLGLKWEEIIGKGIFDNEELNIFCSFSFGISNFPDDGIEFNKLIFVADRRMYENKKEYKLKKLLCKSKDC